MTVAWPVHCSEHGHGQAVRRGRPAQPGTRELRGPAISQMMNPRSGSSRMSSVQSTFAPVEADDPTMLMMAQMLRTSRMNPPMP